MKNSKLLLLLFVSLLLATCKKDVIFIGVGSNARNLLSAAKYTTLNIEIQSMPGFALNTTTITNLENFLKDLINKPNGINITTKQISSTSNFSLNLSDIQTIEKSNRTISNTNTAIGVYIIITDGDYAQNTGDGKVLGIAYTNTSIVMFGKTIHDNSAGRIGQPQRSSLETNVIEHEFGHLLGLVNLGTPLQSNHMDAAHGNHCNVKDCLMYYEAESTGVLVRLNTVPTLDAQCRADLHANGGK